LQAFPWDHAPRYLLRDRDSVYANAMFVIFGVAEVGKAVKIFEQAAAARPST